MKRRLQQRGFGVLPILGMLVVIVAIALLGVRLVGNNKDSSPPTVSSSVPATPSQVKNAADLQTASDSLSNASIDTSTLDTDLNNLL
jgi:hypothetical protein